MRKLKKSVISLLVSLIMISQFFVVYANESSNTTEITILHTNDIHGRYAQEGNIQIGNLATIKKSIENAVLVDAGDSLHGLPFVNLNRGLDAIKLMKSAGYDYMTPGNHDFNYGKDRLVELANIANADGFKIMSSNVLKGSNTLLESNDIKEIGGIKVGFFGLSTEETYYKTNPNNVVGLKFENPITSAKQQVNELKENGAEVIVAISHIGMDESSSPTSTDIAKQVDGIDVIIDGHSHTKLSQGQLVEDTLIASSGDYLSNIGEVKIKIDNETKEITEKKARLISKEEALSYESDKEIDEYVNKIKEEQSSVLSEVIGKTTTELDGLRENVRTGETNLGNLLNDAVIDETKADIAINNGGNIRKTIPVGDITKGDIIEMLPFGNTIVTKELTGHQIKKVLEHGIKDYPNTSGGFPHVAGIKFAFDPNQPVGERVVKITTMDDKHLDMDKKYTVATNDFLAVGGDGFPCFNDVPTINEFGGLEEVLIKYIQKLGTVSYEKEGRITHISKGVQNVIGMINTIGEEITLEDKELIEEIRKAYDALNDEEKELIFNYEKLVKAEEIIKNLESIKPPTEEGDDDQDVDGEEDKEDDVITDETNPTKPTKPTNPQTGDVGITASVCALALSASGLYVYNRKRK